MIEVGLFVLAVASVSNLLQEKLKIPASMTCVAIALLAKVSGIGGIVTDNEMFDSIILLLLPLLLAVDVLHLKLEDVKKHALSLTYVAGVSVGLSVAAGILINSLILPGYDISIPALVMLFCMVSATDPVAVGAVFGNYKVPHNLKVLAEGESLFNDATALVIFSIALMVINTPGDLSGLSIAWKSFQIIFFAIVIGGAVGFIGLMLISITRNTTTETCMILGVAFASFYVAEHWHFSGILAEITGLLIANHVITKRIEDDEKKGRDTEANPKKSRPILVSKLNQQRILGNIHFAAFIGIVILFLSIGDVVNFANLILYWKEVLSVFAASTVIRMVMMLKFSVISNATNKMQNISLHWYKILVFAGVKGGLSILMLHLMPTDFEHKDLFEAIVVGVILLTTFLYPVMLTLTMKWHNHKFDKDCESDVAKAH